MRRHLQTSSILFAAGLLLFAACGHDHDHGDHQQIEKIEIVDRGATNQPIVATWTDEDGWSGELPAISLSSTNQRISLGVRAISEDGEDLIAADDHLEARYALVSGAQTGIIDVDRDNLFHGDHIHIYGVAAGTTQIRVLAWHDDHADVTTDVIGMTVTD